MSRQEIYDPWPSIYWKHSDSALQFHLKAINGPIPSYGKRRKNSTLRAKLLWRNYLLHIESASLCPLSLNTVFIPQALPLLIENFIVSLYELAFGGGLKWWRPNWKELSFSVLNCADTEVCNIFTSVDHILIEILFSHPIDILQIFELLFHGRICHVY
jgi:hypothetical protein